jgi:hypothetical protein
MCRRTPLLNALIPIVGIVTAVGSGLWLAFPADRTTPPAKVAKPDGRQRVFTHVAPAILREDNPVQVWKLPVTNDTGRAVSFIGLDRSCTCTEAELGTWQLAPGEATTLKIAADVRGRSGKQKFICQLGDDAGGVWRYEVETTVYEPARFEGNATAVPFGLVEPNEAVERATTLAVYGSSRADLPDAVRVESSSDRVTAAVAAATTRECEPGIWERTFPVYVRLAAPAEVGTGYTRLTARWTQRGAERTAEITAQWNVRSRFAFDPVYVVFRGSGQNSAVNQPADGREQTVTLRRTDGRGFTIKAVRDCPDGVSHAIEPAEGGYRVKFTLMPRPERRYLSATVLIDTDDANEPILRLTLAGIGW